MTSNMVVLMNERLLHIAVLRHMLAKPQIEFQQTRPEVLLLHHTNTFLT